MVNRAPVQARGGRHDEQVVMTMLGCAWPAPTVSGDGSCDRSPTPRLLWLAWSSDGSLMPKRASKGSVGLPGLLRALGSAESGDWSRVQVLRRRRRG